VYRIAVRHASMRISSMVAMMRMTRRCLDKATMASLSRPYHSARWRRRGLVAPAEQPSAQAMPASTGADVPQATFVFDLRVPWVLPPFHL
jgi:hypothetical protein